MKRFRKPSITWIPETLSFRVWQGASSFLKRGLDSSVLPLFKKGEQRSPNAKNQCFPLTAACHLPMPPAGQGMASLAFSLAPSEAAPLPEGFNVHLFPDGEFAAGDGRPGNMEGSETACWRMDAAIAARIIADAAALKTEAVVDYEHQTIQSRENGVPAPAAGWIRALAYFPGRGLYAKVTWTARAGAHIKADEYRYISPTFTFCRKSGAVTRLLHAALTNYPALDGLAAVAASQAAGGAYPEDTMTKELLAQLQKLLGLPATADETAVVAQLDALRKKVGDGVDLFALAAAQTPPEQTAAAKAAAEQAAKGKAPATQDDDKTVTVPLSVLTALQNEVASLASAVVATQANHAATTQDASITAALADGRLPKALEPWARHLAQNDPAALNAYLAGAKPIVALTRMQTTTVQGQPPAGDAAALTPEDHYTAVQLGMSPAEFAKLKETK